jgi:hypothetical protein
MTDKDAAARALVSEYERNNEAIAALRSTLEKAGRQMSVLGDQLQRDPAKVTVDDGEFYITDEFYVSNMGGAAAIAYRSISSDTIEQSISELRSRMKEKAGLEERMREAGLGKRILD